MRRYNRAPTWAPVFGAPGLNSKPAQVAQASNAPSSKERLAMHEQMFGRHPAKTPAPDSVGAALTVPGHAPALSTGDRP